jgi:predicted Fe-Mo cluster-binding NifX family protein
METLIIACATDEGEQLINRHFGDAKRYDLYELRKDSVEFLRSIENSVPEEQQHADPEKAGNIGQLLKPAGVQVLVSGQFGPNIKRVQKKFVPVIIRVFEIAAALNMLRQHFDEIAQQYERGEERDHLVLRPSKQTSIESK